MSDRASSRPRRRWKQDPQGRRERILEAASVEFGANGYESARMDKIAVEAGVAEGTVYHRFGSKRGLLQAVGERYGEGLVEAAFGDVSPDPSPAEIATIIGNIFAYVRDTHARLGAFILAHQPGEADAARSANREEMIRALETRLARWAETGTTARVHPRVGAELIFGLTETALRECFLGNAGRDQATYVRENTRMIRRYLAVEGEEG